MDADPVNSTLSAAIASIVPGRWAVGVSGGADSVALLALLHDRPDLQLHVVHLNHQTRGAESDADAAFVAELAAKWNLPCTVARISDVKLPCESANRAAQYREARMTLFKQVVATHQLQGVILAHHADDQAETILQRLIRGGGVPALVGIRVRARINGMLVLHPLLQIRREQLREKLNSRGLAWREDVSNASPRFMRNRLRQLLAPRPMLMDSLLKLGEACEAYSRFLDEHSPRLGERFASKELGDVPLPLARHAAGRWLQQRGASPDDINAQSVNKLIAMALDAATAHQQHFPGGLLVRRRRGFIEVKTGRADST